MRRLGSLILVLLVAFSAFAGCVDGAGAPPGGPDGPGRSGSRALDLTVTDHHVVSGTEVWQDVTVEGTGRLSVPEGTFLLARSIVVESGSVLDVPGGTIELTTGERGGNVSLKGYCAHFNVTDGGTVALTGAGGHADTSGPGPYASFVPVSGGGSAVLEVFVNGGLRLVEATVVARGGDGFDLPRSSTSATSAWQEGGDLSGRVAAGGNATVSFYSGTFVDIHISSSNLTAEGGKGGDAASGGNAASSAPGRGGGYCDNGNVTGHVGAGGGAMVSVRSGQAITVSSTDITARGGAGGAAGDGGKAASAIAGGGGGGYPGGDGASYGGSAGSGTVKGEVGTGGDASVYVVSTTSCQVTGASVLAVGGDGGAAGDGGDGWDNAGGGGGGYGGGGGSGRSGLPGAGVVNGDVGSGGLARAQLLATGLDVRDTNVTLLGGRGGDAGDGGDGYFKPQYEGGGGGGGGFGGGGGGGDNVLGASTLVMSRVSNGGPVYADIHSPHAMRLIDLNLTAVAGDGGDAGSGGSGPYGGGGGGGYGGAGGGGGGAYEGGSCTLGNSVGHGGFANLNIYGTPCASPGTFLSAAEGSGGDGSTSKGGGDCGGAGTGRTTHDGDTHVTIPMSIPYLVSPANGSWSTPASFEYYAMDSTTNGSVSEYTFQIDDADDFATPLHQRITTGRQTPCPGLSLGVYHWRVRASYESPYGSTAGWSDVYVLHYVQNRQPMLVGALDDVTMMEDTVDDTSIRLSGVFSDPEGDPLSYAAHGNEHIGVKIGGDGSVTLAPERDWTGKEAITFNATDGFSHIVPVPCISVNVTVLNVNDPPSITTEPPLTVEEGEHYRVAFEAVDPDPTGDTVGWELSTDATFLRMDPVGGVLNGTPSSEDLGTYRVNVTASDEHGASSSLEFDLAVLNVNQPPVILTSPVTNATEEVLYSVQYVAEDPDPTGDVLEWTLETDASFLGIDPVTGVLEGIPDDDDVGVHQVTVRVTDGRGGNATVTFELVVAAVNDAPVVATIPTVEVPEDNRTVIDLSPYVTDPDSDPGDLSVESDHAAVVGTEGLLVTLLYETEVEPHQVEFTVTDGQLGTDSALTVEVVPRNDPPVILGLGDLEPPISIHMSEGTELWLEIVVFDEEGDALSFHLETTLDGHSIRDGDLGLLPARGCLGEHAANLSVTDEGGNVAYLEFTVMVLNVNDPPGEPVIVQPEGTVYLEGEEITFEALVTDPDMELGQVLDVTWSSDLSGVIMTLTSDQDLLFTTTRLSLGHHVITVVVSDGEYREEASIELDVKPVHTTGETSWWGVVIAVVVILAVAVSYLVRRQYRRMRR